MYDFHYGQHKKPRTIDIGQELAKALRGGAVSGETEAKVRELKKVILAYFRELVPTRMDAMSVKAGFDGNILGYNQAIDEMETNIEEEDLKDESE